MKPTQDQIIAWAREVNKSTTPQEMIPVLSLRQMQMAFTLAYEAGAAAEREACAKVCEQRKLPRLPDSTEFDQFYNQAATHCAAAIRARGES